MKVYSEPHEPATILYDVTLNILNYIPITVYLWLFKHLNFISVPIRYSPIRLLSLPAIVIGKQLEPAFFAESSFAIGLNCQIAGDSA